MVHCHLIISKVIFQFGLSVKALFLTYFSQRQVGPKQKEY